METLNKLNKDILFLIALHLDYKDIINFSLSSKKIYKVINNSYFWKTKIILDISKGKRFDFYFENSSILNYFIAVHLFQIYNMKNYKNIDSLIDKIILIIELINQKRGT